MIYRIILTPGELKLEFNVLVQMSNIVKLVDPVVFSISVNFFENKPKNILR